MKKIIAFCSAAILFSSGTTLVLAQDSGQAQKSEKSQQELKVSDQEMKQQVTDANKASKLIGMKVKNKQDEELGKISDLVVDFQSGKIAYAVLTSGSTLGFGGKMVAVPIQAFTLLPGEKALIVDLKKQQLSQAPGFTDQNWPDLDAAKKGQTAGLAQSQQEAQGGTGAQSQQTGSSPPQLGSITSLQQLTASADPSRVEGQPVRISSAKFDEAFGQNLISVSSESGQKVLVKTQRPTQNLQPGQTVQITGTARKMPTDAAQLGLDEQSIQKVKDQKVYIQATQVTPSDQ
jgi:sporulation protein YlmC with PRC-barrel domain